MASVAAAQRQVREFRRLNNTLEEMRIILRGGVYQLDRPLFFSPEDSGNDTTPTVIESAPNEWPVLSGGVMVKGWRKLTQEIPGLPASSKGQIWVAEAPVFNGKTVKFRQLWINEWKAVRAREPNGENMERIISLSPDKKEMCIPVAIGKVISNLSGIEMTVIQEWTIAVLRINSVRVEDNKVCVTFHEPESKIEFEHAYPRLASNSPFFLANAAAFLDKPGEWFQTPDGRILYWPRSNEDLTKEKVVIPTLDTLVQISGSLDRPVEHIIFKGIKFSHTSWMRPSEFGHVSIQAGMYMTDGYKLTPAGTPENAKLDNQAWAERPPAAVLASGAHHIRFERCRFEHLASAGLDFVSGTHDDVIEGCVFRDIGGNGIQIGSFQDGHGVEAHIPYNPADEREICTRERIANNLVTDCTNEDWGCVGIAVGYSRDIVIEHNEINNLSYSGISVGWGWTSKPNVMRNNKIHANHIHNVVQRLADAGGIYTLSPQPNTVISENYIHDISPGQWAHNRGLWFYVYLDEGSNFMTIRDNWCTEEKFSKHENGPNNKWDRNGPTVAKSIQDNAGLETPFRDLLLDKTQ
jgi:hypothetical protein